MGEKRKGWGGGRSRGRPDIPLPAHCSLFLVFLGPVHLCPLIFSVNLFFQFLRVFFSPNAFPVSICAFSVYFSLSLVLFQSFQ